MLKRIKNLLSPFRRKRAEGMTFDVAFRYFREILGSNNIALDVMSDMGEKLSGDYLFDINYVKRAYSKLSEAMSHSLNTFNALAGNKYPGLMEKAVRIDSMIKKVVSEEEVSEEQKIPLSIFIDEITWEMREAVGGKIFNLSEIRNYLRLNTPDGFVLTTSAFDEFMRHNGLLEKINVYPPEQLRSLIMKADIPPLIDNAIKAFIGKLRERGIRTCAVRSSAQEEDSEVSFAGQFETVLNVPLEAGAVREAYKKVIASLFSERVIAYQRELGFEPGRLKMAVGCIAMVDAEVSGVIYTEYPLRDKRMPSILITSSYGLGKSVVDGEVEADHYILTKETEPILIEERIGKKKFMWISRAEGGIIRIDTPEEKRTIPSLSNSLLKDLVRESLLIERHFGSPQDIEWTVDKDGNLIILQARPIHGLSEGSIATVSSTIMKDDYRILFKDRGIIVQKGTGAGRVFVIKHLEDLDRFPKGAVLIADHDSSEFVRIMPYASAIITRVGSPTSHMASLSREFRVPTIVNTGDSIDILRHGLSITVVAEDGITIYAGILREFLEKADISRRSLEALYEFRKKRYILRYITPLNLTDPLRDDFTPEGCKTIHDILRFIHEKSVEALVEKAESGARDQKPIRLELPIPAGIKVIDIGGGLILKEGQKVARFDDISSIPLRALIKGMMHPGVWHSDMVPLSVGDFITGMMRAPEITADTSMETHIAIAGKEYVNLSLRFGYHLNMLDCYCSPVARNNHIYFRFMGGATDITKRSRRVRLIAEILKEYGFNIKTQGDLIVARLANIRQDEMENILDQLGRLIAYTRQLDAVLNDDGAVERYSINFLKENYGL